MASAFIIVQLLASILAALLVILIMPLELQADGDLDPLDFPKNNILMNEFSAFILETMSAFLFTWMYFSMIFDSKCDDKNVFGYAIGACLVLSQLAHGNLTGACVNPMNHFGPSLLSMNSTHIWVFWLGPMFGTFFAGFYYSKVILNADDDKSKRKGDSAMDTIENQNEAMHLTY